MCTPRGGETLKGCQNSDSAPNRRFDTLHALPYGPVGAVERCRLVGLRLVQEADDELVEAGEVADVAQ